MSAGFTPGPWAVHDTIDGPLANTDVRDRSNKFVARCAPACGRPHVSETEANARLIAAAPDLYASASSILASLEGGGLGSNRQIEALRAAIAKADGEAA